MQADLRSNPEGWLALTKIPTWGELTPLRALDIIAWQLGKDGATGLEGDAARQS
jgi:hypothetical protein